MSEKKTYFIQDTRSYVGNSVMWWRVDGHGYTCHLEDAWEVDEEKARRIERGRDTDKAWPADIVRAAASMHVDAQRLPERPELPDAAGLVSLSCSACGKGHADEGTWAERAHRTHRCVDDAYGKGCGSEWRVEPAVFGKGPAHAS